MNAPGLGLAHAPEDDPGESPGREPIAERALSGLFGGRWRLYTGTVVIVPRSTPAYAGATLSDVIGQISGAAVWDRCPNGTGWPAGRSR